MKIDDVLLKKLEKLTAIEIPENEREDTKKQLSQIVDFVEVLNEMDLEGIEATVNTIEGGTPFREDLPFKDENIIKDILAHATNSKDGYFKVPKIID